MLETLKVGILSLLTVVFVSNCFYEDAFPFGLSGTVIDEVTKEPVSDAMVVAIGEDGTSESVAETDPTGYFDLALYRPQLYTVRFLSEQHELLEIAVLLTEEHTFEFLEVELAPISESSRGN